MSDHVVFLGILLLVALVGWLMLRLGDAFGPPAPPDRPSGSRPPSA